MWNSSTYISVLTSIILMTEINFINIWQPTSAHKNALPQRYTYLPSRKFTHHFLFDFKSMPSSSLSLPISRLLWLGVCTKAHYFLLSFHHPCWNTVPVSTPLASVHCNTKSFRLNRSIPRDPFPACLQANIVYFPPTFSSYVQNISILPISIVSWLTNSYLFT